MAATPLYVGQTHRPLSCTWVDDTGAAVDLGGAALSLRFGGIVGSSSFAGAGTINIINSSQGKFTYAFAASDVATDGNWRLQFKADYGGGGVQFSDPVPLQILPDV